ncbi:MAG: hypothetical protein ACOC5I_01405 [Gemmatimonadota bacterium]
MSNVTPSLLRTAPAVLAVVLAGCGTDVSGPSASLLSCVFTDPVATEVGQVMQVGGAEVQEVCLAGGVGADMVYIPFFAVEDEDRELALEVTGAGVVSTGSASSSRLEPGAVALSRGSGPAQRYTVDRTFHDRLRQREIRELEPRIRAGSPAPGLEQARVAADVPVVGELRDFNVAISCEEVDRRTGRVMYVSERAVIYADTANPADLTSQDYAYFGDRFDDLIYPVETDHFGPPTDIDGNERSILFFTRAVNERNPQSAQSVTIGFFWSGDLFPETDTDRLQACPESNHSEMFYLIAPDPDGQAGFPFSLEEVRELAIPLIGHEFQHLINASRRLFVNQATAFEAPWLNEGLSHVAEELIFFAEAGLETGQNIGVDVLREDSARVDAFNRYMGANFNNYAKFLSRPDTASLMGPPNDLATRGAAWGFLRYAADRSGSGDEAFFFDVVNGRVAGLDNLDDLLGDGETLRWMQDWTVSIYSDDLVPGLDPRFEMDTWDLRSVYGGSTLEEYPLQVVELGGSRTDSYDLPGGGTLFSRFGVASDARAVIHVTAEGRAPPRTLRGSFIRVR